MLFNDTAFIGITPTSGRKSFTYAVVDKDLNLLALTEGGTDDVVSHVAGQQNVTVAINAPFGVNRGLVREKMKKATLTPRQIRGAEMRMSEYELRERGILVAGTPSVAASCPSWMQAAFEMIRKLSKSGFKKYPEEDAAFQMLETHPHACFCVMAEDVPLVKSSLEGRLQRQLLLYERGLRIKDPMDFFEEITRYKMVKGIWPMELLYSSEQLDALVAAYTAWSVVNKPEATSSVGNAKEGLVFLPVHALKEKY